MLENIELELFIYKINTPKIISHLREFLLPKTEQKKIEIWAILLLTGKPKLKCYARISLNFLA